MNLTTKNHIIGIVCVIVILLLTLAGCRSSRQAPAAQLVNPMQEVTLDEMTEKTSVPLYFPQGAEDVHYFVVNNGDQAIAQMDFKLNGKAYTYRGIAVEVDALTLSGVYFTKAAETDTTVDYAKGKLLTEGKTAVLFWEDVVPGVSYCLTCTECDNPMTLSEIAASTFVPLQGDSDGNAESPAK